MWLGGGARNGVLDSSIETGFPGWGSRWGFSLSKRAEAQPTTSPSNPPSHEINTAGEILFFIHCSCRSISYVLIDRVKRAWSAIPGYVHGQANPDPSRKEELV